MGRGANNPSKIKVAGKPVSLDELFRKMIDLREPEDFEPTPGVWPACALSPSAISAELIQRFDRLSSSAKTQRRLAKGITMIASRLSGVQYAVILRSQADLPDMYFKALNEYQMFDKTAVQFVNVMGVGPDARDHSTLNYEAFSAGSPRFFSPGSPKGLLISYSDDHVGHKPPVDNLRNAKYARDWERNLDEHSFIEEAVILRGFALNTLLATVPGLKKGAAAVMKKAGNLYRTSGSAPIFTTSLAKFSDYWTTLTDTEQRNVRTEKFAITGFYKVMQEGGIDLDERARRKC